MTEAVPAPVDFKNPPLDEVVFSIQFEAPVIDEVGALSDFWPEIKVDFPGLEKQMPMPPASESFEVPPPPGQFEFQLMQAPPSQRYWFVSQDETKLVQVQNDRLMFNWRRRPSNANYPRFERLWPEFIGHVETFLRILGESARASAKVAWCELTYINPVETDDGEPGTHGQLARILDYLELDPSRNVLPPVEDTQLQQRFRILDDADQPIGRLYVTAVPAFHQVTARPAYVITLLARGRPTVGTLPECIAPFFEKAHHLIVNGFVEVTTKEMHDKWIPRAP